MIGPCPPILHELNDKARYGGKQNRVDEAALMQQKFLDKPKGEQDCTYDPKHFDSGFLLAQRAERRNMWASVTNLRKCRFPEFDGSES